LHSSHQHELQTRPSLRAVSLLVAAYALLLGVGTALLANRVQAMGLAPTSVPLRLGLAVLTLELLFVAAFASWLKPRGQGLLQRLGLSILVPLLAALVVSVLVPIVVAGGAVPVATLAWAQLYVGGIGISLASLKHLLRRLGLRPIVAQAAGTALAFVLLGSVFYVNPVIEALESSAAKTAAARAVLHTNPWLVATGSILQADPLRSERLYDWCIIGDYQFPVGYPAASLGGPTGVHVRAAAVSTGPLAAACLFLLLARVLPQRSSPSRAPD
jgi:hypothetical protein